MTRHIDLVVVHCTATKPSQNINIDDVRQWHVDKGWSDVGYHYVIDRQGALQHGRPEASKGAHAKGYNALSIGVCLVGGVDEQGVPDANFTKAQYDTLKFLLNNLTVKYPDARVLGHRDLPGVHKQCPCFDVQSWWGV